MEEKYKQWLAWVNNRIQALDLIDEKLHQMKELAQEMQQGNLNQEQITVVNQKFKQLEQEVNQLDEQSRNYITH